MATRIGINGFGRIGRQVLRASMERHPDKLEVVAVNDLTNAKTNAHLFKYDTNYGVYPGTVAAEENALVIDGKEVQVLAERDPRRHPLGRPWAWTSLWSQRASSRTQPRRPGT